MRRAILILALVLTLLAQQGAADDLRDGYFYDGYWTPGLVTWHFYQQVGLTNFTTRALYQNEGVIDQTAAYKGLTLDGVEGYVALMSPAVSGWKAWIRMPDDARWIPVRVADVVAQEHYYYHVVNTESALELSYELAQATGTIDRINPDGSLYTYGVQVCLTENHPEIVCAEAGRDYTEWFIENVRFYPNLTFSQAFAANPIPR